MREESLQSLARKKTKFLILQSKKASTSLRERSYYADGLQREQHYDVVMFKTICIEYKQQIEFWGQKDFLKRN